MKLKYLGQSGFILKTDNISVGIDIWLNNPKNKITRDEVSNLDFLLLTHDHADHGIGDLDKTLSEDTKLITNYELANHLKEELGNENIIAANLGGRLTLNDKGIDVVMTSALHSANVGIPTGFIIFIENEVIYHMGDTAISSDFELINKLYKPNVLLIPIGGHFTMGIEEATLATDMINAETIIPMHYGTFPLIDADPEEFQSKVGDKVCILELNQEIDLG